MSITMQLEEESVPDPLDILKKMLGAAWEVTQEEGRFVCSRDGVVYYTSGVYIGEVYKSTLLSIAYFARKAYGNV